MRAQEQTLPTRKSEDLHKRRAPWRDGALVLRKNGRGKHMLAAAFYILGGLRPDEKERAR